MKQLTNAQIHDFNKESLFYGTFTGEKLVRKEDDPKDVKKKKGDIMAYEFIDSDGSKTYVGASATIMNIMEENTQEIGAHAAVEKGTVMSFEFGGKGKTKQNREFNKFEVFSWDNLEEVENHFNPK